MKCYLSLILFTLILTTIQAISRSNNSSVTKLHSKQKHGSTAESRGYEQWIPEGFGSSSELGLSGKQSDYYWLIPLVIVIGFGALLLPLLGTLMTTMITQGTLTMSAGRRKRSTDDRLQIIKNSQKFLSEPLTGFLENVENALEKFGKITNHKK